MPPMEERILNYIDSLPGVVDTAVVHREDIPGFLAAENKNLSGQLITVRNLGVEVAAAREELVVLLKDKTFRPPPCPTLLLVEDAESPGAPPEEYIEVSGSVYHIIGEEVMNNETDYDEKHLFLDGGFVLFTERREKRQPVPAFFILPPIAFHELDEKKDSFPIMNIVSVSPSSHGDEYLRSTYNFSKAREYATILVGWDYTSS